MYAGIEYGAEKSYRIACCGV